MTALIVVGAIAVVGAVVARVTWRRPGDERHSIQSHQQTLETLRSMADRRSDRPVGGRADTGTGPPSRPPRARPGPARAGPQPGLTRSGQARSGTVRAPASPTPSGNGHSDLVFVDDAAPASPPDGSPRIPAVALSRGLPRAGRGHRRGLDWRRRGGSPVLPVVAAVAVLGVVVGVALALAPSHPRAAHHRSDSRPKTSAHARHQQTTVPVPLQVRPTTSTVATASYSAPSSGYTVGLQATGPCWVEATETSTGKVAWTGTLASGQTQAIAATGNLVIRLGAANDVSVTLNGEQVVLPPGFRSPFDMTISSP